MTSAIVTSQETKDWSTSSPTFLLTIAARLVSAGPARIRRVFAAWTGTKDYKQIISLPRAHCSQ